MKKSIYVLLIVALTICVCIVGCSEAPVPASSEGTSIGAVEPVTEENLKKAAQDFTKAFLSGDQEQIKPYLSDPTQLESFRPVVYSGVNPEEIRLIAFQGASSQPDGTVLASCGFLTKDAIQILYLDIVFQLVDEEWKVVHYYLQG